MHMVASKQLKESTIGRMVEHAFKLPSTDLVPELSRRQLVGDKLSRHASSLVEAFKPVLDAVDWETTKGMNPAYAKQYTKTAQLLCAADLANHLKGGGMENLRMEASTAGVDLPTFTRQLLMTITRAYPKLYTLQLFGVLPLQGPTGRLVFKDSLFDSAYTGSTPNIAVGDRQDDLTKWNPDFFKVPEGVLANKLRTTRSILDISTSDYRVLSEWSDSYADDVASVYDANADAEEAEQRAWNMSRLIDRLMLNALVNNVPSGATISFTAQPTNNPNYAQLSPSEKLMYDENVWRDGVLKVIQQIRIARKYGDDAEVTWAICGTDFAQTISRLSMFHAYQQSDQIDVETGPMRDLGTIKGSGIRFIVDPALTISSSSNVCLFGHRPMSRGAVGLYWAPYVNLQPTRDFYDPNLGLITKGTRSRFGIIQPNTETNPASSQLADIYGLLKVV
jgi:hypothetical protein